MPYTCDAWPDLGKIQISQVVERTCDTTADVVVMCSNLLIKSSTYISYLVSATRRIQRPLDSRSLVHRPGPSGRLRPRPNVFGLKHHRRHDPRPSATQGSWIIRDYCCWPMSWVALEPPAWVQCSRRLRSVCTLWGRRSCIRNWRGWGNGPSQCTSQHCSSDSERRKSKVRWMLSNCS